MEAPTAESMAEFAGEFKAFIDAAPTPFHVCTESIAKLKAQGFSELREDTAWAKGGLVKPGGKYYYTRNMSTLVAFTVGEKFAAGGGFKVVGAHTDSPVLKLKPASKKSSHGYMQVNVEVYGGGLWHTWFDRELGLAGSVIVAEPGGGFKRKLVRIQSPLLRVPTLCIHLQSADERAQFAPNKETHLQPILAMVEDTLNKAKAPTDKSAGTEGDRRHAPELLALLAGELGCEPQAIQDFELSLCDTQGGQFWGLRKEFFSSPRLDNQIHCFTGLMALLRHASSGLADDSDVSMLCCFDHEEVGSESACGAGSTVMQEAIQRVAGCFANGDEELYKVSIRKSLLVSADVAHAVHPNYAGKHEANHLPLLNGGTVLKTNDNQRYATNAETGFFLRELARRAGVETQEFMVKNDCPCGTTIGPIIAAKVGIRTVDIGVPSLSMHSIRETIGVADITSNYQLLATFYKEFRALDESCQFIWS
eukprot:TRINITY_DN4915_c0_g1_i1.p1 TRINITY_DN4915_c0_g1~~TRINITY_DN4915_c0_g1_i1.p1  ORF type:complete len:478 (+),score=104.35 TRINITY_DN4915_c0_g1_i1:71-1504(+)